MRRFLNVQMVAVILLATSVAGNAALQHRYSFDADASDSVGTAHGALMGTTGSIAGGMVELPGGGINATNAYVSLPGPTIAINTYTQVTLQAWFRFDAVAGNFQKLFAFGGTQTTGGLEWAGKQYLLGGLRSGGAGPCDAAISNAQEGDGDPWTEEANVVGSNLSVGDHHMAVVVDDTIIAIYVDGILAETDLLSSSPTGASLDQLSNDLAYLGRSVYADALMGGAIDEFRIYDSVLSSLDIGIDFALGPDDISGDPGAITGRAVIAEDTVVDGAKQAILELTYASAGTIGVGSDPLLVWSSSDTNIVSVTPAGVYTGHQPGTVTLTATFDGVPSSSPVTVEGTTLRHRWAFNGTAVATDSNSLSFTEQDLVGTADGTVWGPGAARLGDGTLELSSNPTTDTSRDNGYVDLPNGIISALSSITLETWVTPRSSAGGWERIFDVGTTTIGEVLPGNTSGYSGSGTDWFYWTAYRNQDPNISIRRDGVGQEVVPRGISWYDQLAETELHAVATYDTASGQGKVYVNGELVQTGPLGGSLSTLPDVNVWLGRSIWQGDANMNGLFNEFRIYEGVLSPREVAISAQLGPDSPGGDPGAAGAQSIVSQDSVVVGGAKSLQLSVQYASLAGPVVFQTDKDLAWSSSDTNILLVTDDGVMTGGSTGTVTVTATFDGTDSTKSIAVTDRMLKHRYTFNGDLNFDLAFTEPDIVSGADATVINAYERNGAGQIELFWDFAGYVDLPNGVISSLGSGTFEAWLTPREGGQSWERIFSFGNSTYQDGSKAVADQDGEIDETVAGGYVGGENVELNARVGTGSTLRFNRTGGEMAVPDVSYLLGMPIHVVAVYDTAAQTSTLYLNGIPVGSDDTAPLIDSLPDVNNFLGRSAFSADGYLDGFIDEFRIYEGVLTAGEIAVNTGTGPDGDPFLVPGTLTSLDVDADDTDLVVDGNTAQAVALANYDNVGGVPVNGSGDVTWRSENEAVITVDTNGVVTAEGAGAANVWAEYQGLSNSVQFSVVAIIKPTTLAHRYSFGATAGPGSTSLVVTDAVGSAHGTLINPDFAEWTGTALDLQGAGASTTPNGAYVDLPNGTISSLSGAVTFEVLYTWDGDAAGNWQRVIDFGTGTNGEALPDYVVVPGNGSQYLFLTPAVGAEGGDIRCAVTMTGGGAGETVLGTPPPAGYLGSPTHVVLTWDSDDNLSRMYVNGTQVDSTDAPIALAGIDDVNNWFGRSNWGADGFFDGRLDEVLIYNGIMTGDEVAARYAELVPVVPDRPRIESAVIAGTDLVLSWTEEAGQPTFGVETAAALEGGTNTSWSATGLTPTETNGVKQVTVPLVDDEAHYRLTE